MSVTLDHVTRSVDGIATIRANRALALKVQELSAARSALEAAGEKSRRLASEAERANLLAQVAWERAIAQEQQKSLELELARTATLSAELERQQQRIEQLKALTAWDRLRGKHKSI